MGTKASVKQTNAPAPHSHQVILPIKDDDFTFKQPPIVSVHAKNYHPYSSSQQQNLLIYGYVREYYNKFIPQEIINLFINMIEKYNKNKFKWFFDSNNLSKILSNTYDFEVDITIENNQFSVYLIKSFQLIIKMHKYYLLFMLHAPSSSINKNKKRKIKRKRKEESKYLVTIFIEETHYKLIGFKGKAKIPLNKFKGLSSLHFGFVIDVISMEGKSNQIEFGKYLITYYFNKILINQNINKKWILSNKLLPSMHTITNINEYLITYCSELFNNNNFQIIFQRSVNNHDNINKLIFCIECLRFPFHIQSMTIFSNIKIKINDKQYIYNNTKKVYPKTGMNDFCRKELDENADCSLDKIEVEVNIKIIKISSYSSGRNTVNVKDKLLWKYYGIIVEEKELEFETFLLKKTNSMIEYDTIFDNSCKLAVNRYGDKILGNSDESFVIASIKKEFDKKLEKQQQEIELLKKQLNKIKKPQPIT